MYIHIQIFCILHCSKTSIDHLSFLVPCSSLDIRCSSLTLLMEKEYFVYFPNCVCIWVHGWGLIALNFMSSSVASLLSIHVAMLVGAYVAMLKKGRG